ncbi:MAG: SDR family oxidoreductase [Herminiimonas sp.]|nr:SDR family oxidoreductase [Herminiimonas sp.]
MKTTLIIGASRGIGFELARQYRADAWRVLATVRKAANGAALTALGCEVHVVDVTKTDDCAALGRTLANARLDVAIVGAGVYGPRDGAAALASPTAEEFDTVMHTNVLAAMRLLPVLGPLVAGAGGRLAVLSSRMGSLSLRENASGWLYRASKAALNSVLIDTALTFGPHGAICVAFHPGWVRTDMGGAGAEVEVVDSAAGIRATLASLTAADNASFINFDGARLTW